MQQQVVCSYLTNKGIQIAWFDNKEAERLKSIKGDTFCIHHDMSMSEVLAKREAFTHKLFQKRIKAFKEQRNARSENNQ